MISKYYIFGNFIITASVASFVIAQILKTILNTIKIKNFDVRRLVGSGGMPSSHSATVASLVIAMGRQEGLSSPIFALSVIFAIVVLHDAMGVRRAAGEHAKRLNFLFGIDFIEDFFLHPGVLPDEDDIENMKKIEKNENGSSHKKLQEYLGHTPFEVFCGIVLGATIAMLLPLK